MSAFCVRIVCEQKQRSRKTGTLPVLTSHVCDGGSARSCRSLCALHNSCSILSEAAVVAYLLLYVCLLPLCLPLLLPLLMPLLVPLPPSRYHP